MVGRREEKRDSLEENALGEEKEGVFKEVEKNGLEEEEEDEGFFRMLAKSLVSNCVIIW